MRRKRAPAELAVPYEPLHARRGLVAVEVLPAARGIVQVRWRYLASREPGPWRSRATTARRAAGIFAAARRRIRRGW